MAATALTADSANVQCKTCTKCGEVKPVGEFSRAATGAFGVRGDCRRCRRRIGAQWYADLPEYIKQARGRTPEHKAYMASYTKKFADKLREQKRAWVERNPETARRVARETMRRRRATARGKLQANVSRALHRALKGRKNGAASFVLLDYTVEQLIDHLERQFARGMSWGNYGKWHVDHIRPLSSFEYDRATDAGFKEAWALTNLRPLWARDNLSKSGRRTLLL